MRWDRGWSPGFSLSGTASRLDSNHTGCMLIARHRRAIRELGLPEGRAEKPVLLSLLAEDLFEPLLLLWRELHFLEELYEQLRPRTAKDLLDEIAEQGS